MAIPNDFKLCNAVPMLNDGHFKKKSETIRDRAKRMKIWDQKGNKSLTTNIF